MRILLILLVILLFSCSRNTIAIEDNSIEIDSNKLVVESKPKPKGSDTLIKEFIVKGTPKTLTYQRWNENIIEKAVNLSNLEDPLSYRKVLLEDVTNDGEEDSLIWELNNAKKGYSGYFEIIVNGERKWSSSSYQLDTSNSYFSGKSIFWQGDTTNFKILYPYSQMAILAMYEIKPNMIKPYESDSYPNETRENIKFSTWITGDTFSNAKLDSLTKYIKSYKGKVISVPSYNSEPYYLYWVDYDSSFIVMY